MRSCSQRLSAEHRPAGAALLNCHIPNIFCCCMHALCAVCTLSRCCWLPPSKALAHHKAQNPTKPSQTAQVHCTWQDLLSHAVPAAAVLLRELHSCIILYHTTPCRSAAVGAELSGARCDERQLKRYCLSTPRDRHQPASFLNLYSAGGCTSHSKHPSSFVLIRLLETQRGVQKPSRQCTCMTTTQHHKAWKLLVPAWNVNCFSILQPLRTGQSWLTR